MEIKCPHCGSDNVVVEFKTEVLFKFNKRGDIEIVSKRQDVIEQIQKEFGGFNCKCQKCNFGFAKFINLKGANLQ